VQNGTNEVKELRKLLRSAQEFARVLIEVALRIAEDNHFNVNLKKSP
jgi:hypothetical protein